MILTAERLDTMKITTAHGGGGKATGELIHACLAKYYGNDILNKMEDSSIVEVSGRIAMTTDSFVVTPLFFKGGDIGRLCVCGTVNDLLMSGAIPRYLTVGFILEEGADTDDIEKISESIALTAKEAGIQIVAGDTKVIEGKGGIYINTSGVGTLPEGRALSSSGCQTGDAILVSGTMGDHHAAILSARMGIENAIVSDCAPLNEAVDALFQSNIRVRTMRDVTRGGLGTIIKELAAASGLGAVIEEQSIPVSPEVQGFCGLLGLDPLYMGNEGKFVAVVDSRDAEASLKILRTCKYAEHAAVIGHMTEGSQTVLRTAIGGSRTIDLMTGEGLPRIC